MIFQAPGSKDHFNIDMNKQIKVAILGSGNIGIDLLMKVIRSKKLLCIMVSGKDFSSKGMKIAKRKGIQTSDQGIKAIMKIKDNLDIVFDATSASAHLIHSELLKKTNIKIIDMTPSGVGKPVVPVINQDKLFTSKNVNMITCGGQASLPIINAISNVSKQIEYIEVVSSIASKSAGPATRANIDEYIKSTENGIKLFSKTKEAKVRLILNPAKPPINMQTSISFIITDPNIELLKKSVKHITMEVKQYVPGYELILEPTEVVKDRVMVMVKTTGLGDYLPSYAGNLDIINSAAIAVAEKL